MAAEFGFGREQVSGPNRDALAAVALRRTHAGLGAADIEVNDAGRMPARQLPTIHLAGDVACFGEQWWRLHVEQPAAHANTVVHSLRAHGLGGLARIARNCALVDVGNVGEVE